MCGWTGHIQGNLALRVCEPPCGECAVQRQILSPGTAKLRRVLRTKQPKRSRGRGLLFASARRGAPRKQGTATTRGKEFLSRDCGQKWVPPGACRFSTRCKSSRPCGWELFCASCCQWAGVKSPGDTQPPWSSTWRMICTTPWSQWGGARKATRARRSWLPLVIKKPYLAVHSISASL